MEVLQNYGSESDSEDKTNLPTNSLTSIQELKCQLNINLTPAVPIDKTIDPLHYLSKDVKEITQNYTYDEMFAPDVGPKNPHKTQQSSAIKNTFSGYVEPENVNESDFEIQRKTFYVEGHAIDPSINSANATIGTVPDETASFHKKRKKVIAKDPSDIEGFLGPWAKFVDEETVSRPTEEQQVELKEILAKRKKKTEDPEKIVMEKSVLHIPDPYDYQNRSFLHAPHDLGVNLRADYIPDRCYIPKKLLHCYSGHTKGISTIRWFPRSAHLFLSAGMDAKIKLWEAYSQRRVIMTYSGHLQAIRDVSFNNNGRHFLSAGYDKYIKMWDTETGKAIAKFPNRKVCYCVRFNPTESLQHLFLAGMSNKKVLCFDTRSSEVVQEYDRHLGAVNSITFIDNNKKFATTSDDKTMRIWEWDIPVDTHYVADPSMHALPCVTLSPNQKWLACQSMDNKIMMYQVMGGLRWRKKKTFRGHMVAGYGCSPDFSPDQTYVITGDADGKIWIWDWNTTKVVTSFKAHDDVCISVLWHPHETSKILSAGWDGKIKLWD